MQEKVSKKHGPTNIPLRSRSSVKMIQAENYYSLITCSCGSASRKWKRTIQLPDAYYRTPITEAQKPYRSFQPLYQKDVMRSVKFVPRCLIVLFTRNWKISFQTVSSCTCASSSYFFKPFCNLLNLLQVNMAGRALATDQVKIWAETMGIHNLSEETADFVAACVSQKVSAIVDRANKNANMCRRMKILKTDVDNAMQFLNLEPTVDSGVVDYIPIRGVSGVGGKTLFVHDDKDRDLLSTTKKPAGPAPPEVTLRQHWLAIEGKMPSVPENPPAQNKDEQKAKATNPLQARTVATERAIRKSQFMGIKDLSTSELSSEQQQYYKDVTEAVIGNIEEKRREALSSLEHDPGLHALIPRLAVFISEGVKVNVVQQNLALLIYVMRMVKALLDNQMLYLQPYLHLIIPAITSCIVSRTLCVRPEADNHWALRGFASRILASISRTYDTPTSRLSQRLIQVFKDCLDDESTALSTRFGAYSALIELGNEAIALMVVPRIKHEAEALRAYLNQANTNAADKRSAEQIREKLVTKLAEYCYKVKPHMDKLDDFRAEFGPILAQPIFDQVMKERLKDPSRARSPPKPANQMQSPHSVGGHHIGSPRVPAAPSPSSSLTGAISPYPPLQQQPGAPSPNNPFFARPSPSYPRPTTPGSSSSSSSQLSMTERPSFQAPPVSGNSIGYYTEMGPQSQQNYQVNYEGPRQEDGFSSS
ncbi:hypothetical protein RvY_14395 [Ramazzottius varieornatus]|uniref:Transcription initiation factor TFIID subunit 6 n=1 Tax=Ramazzottius varieornatus TaxID=947166 RepID=A0A1D1VT59_RAMVA|nr:hypothetical protein RvY_14395 [Ramazzottius varieornatus]